jgi:hypothetical protein
MLVPYRRLQHGISAISSDVVYLDMRCHHIICEILKKMRVLVVMLYSYICLSGIACQPFSLSSPILRNTYNLFPLLRHN